MRIETQERTKRLEGAAKLLLDSQESAEVNAEVALQINVYHTILVQLEGAPDHTRTWKRSSSRSTNSAP